jgi:cation diffusion facilitator CzcD-associated flavoprotein CzcO
MNQMSTTTEAKRADHREIEDLDVIIVGAGFAGLYLLDRLRSLGMSVQVFEAGGGLGGVWYWNCYPGARVDSPGPVYQYSRADLWRKWQFSELYPSWQELREYFHFVDEQLGLSRDIRFHRRVDEAAFDPARNRWTIRSNDGSVASARYFVLCTGLSAKPYVPDLPGLRDFAGERHHTALWPQQGLDMAGKRGRDHRHGRKRRAGGARSRRRGGSPYGLPAHAQLGVADAAEEARRGHHSPHEGKVSGDL